MRRTNCVRRRRRSRASPSCTVAAVRRPDRNSTRRWARIESEVGRMRVLVNDLLQLARLDEERPLGRVRSICSASRPRRSAMPTCAYRKGLCSWPARRCGSIRSTRHRASAMTTGCGRSRRTWSQRVAAHRGTTPCGGAGRPTGHSPTTVPPTASVGREISSDTPVAVLEVTDTGPGMSAEEAQRVFERLYRVERSRDRRHGGAGLGLAIVAAIVVAHHGRVELTTALGAGSTFRVILPAADDLDDFEDEDESSEDFPSFPEVDVEGSRK